MTDEMPDLQLTTTLSTFLILAAALVSIGLAVAAYRTTTPPVSGRLRSLLIILRAVGLFLLVLLLGEPLLSIIFHRTEKPLLVVLLDQSRSMTIRDKSGARNEITQQLAESRVFNDLQSHADVVFAGFDSRLHVLTSTSRDSLLFQGDATDISGALRETKSRFEDRNLRGILLLTDGVATAGSSALAAAEELGIPVSAVGIGDTSMPQDLVVQRVVANTITYVGTKVPVNATIRSSGFGEEKVEVLLAEGGMVRDRKTVTLESGIRQYDVPLSFTPDADGTRKITVEVSQLPGELSAANNRSSLFVKVLKSRMKILLFGGAPSADLAAFRRALQSDANCEVKTFVEKGAGQFYEGVPSPQDVREAECFVLIGYPSSSSATAMLRMLAEECAGGKGLLFVLSRSTDFGKLSALEASLPFVLPSRQGAESQTFFTIAESQRTNPILRTTPPADVWAKLPPVFMLDEPVKPKPETEILASGRIQSVATSEPLLMSRRVNRLKSLAFTCYGIWRWESYSEGIPGAEHLLESVVSNSIRWLVTRDDEKPVHVRPVKEMFAGSEPVEFTGQVYDDSYEPVEDAEVSITVTRENQTSQLTLTSLGNGRFEGAFDPLPEGDYTYSVRAASGGRDLARETGSFSVGGLNAEFLDTRANRLLLQQIAVRTGGKYYEPGNLSRLAADAEQMTDFKPRDVALTHRVEVWNRSWMMLALVFFFSMEWFLRKRNGML